jgi:protein phosphatase
LNAYGLTDRGLQRQLNEDSFYFKTSAVGPYPNLFIVADGMGGHNAGDFASRYTVDCVVRALESWSGDFLEGFKHAIKGANDAVLSHSKINPDLSGMGTTLVMISVWDDHYLAANVGDSRCYLFRDSHLTQISKDHSWVEEMCALGQLERDSEVYRARKNIITRAVGASEEILPDYFEGDIRDGDRFLLCSDGLTNMLSDRYIETILSMGDEPIRLAGKLVRSANEAGGSDNISVVLINP